MFRELSLSLRALRRAPGFAASALLTLAFGIGATTAIFTVLYGVLLRPLPYEDPARLVVLLHEGQFAVSPPDFLAYQRESRSYTSVAAAQVSGATLTGAGDPLRVDGLAVTANMFAALGVPAALGRTFAPGEGQPGRNRVVVLSDALWRERFGAARDIIGRVVTLDGGPYTVIGVMPPEFRFAPFWATGAKLWRPLTLTARLNDRFGRSLRVFARLKPGISIDTAQAEASAIAARLAAAFPDSNEKLGMGVVPLHEKVTSGIRPTLILLVGMAALVLLIACVNVASLLLVRGTVRQKELAVRTALGAGRRQLVAQMLLETLLLGTGGGVLGLIFAAWSIAALVSLLPPGSVPRQQEIGLDPVVFACAAGLALVSALLAAFVPALQVWRVDVHESLREGGRTVTEHGSARHVRRTLLAVELALAMALLAGAGLMGRTLLAMQAIDPGFDPHGVLAVTVAVDGSPHAARAARAPYFDQVESALARVPGVQGVGAINHLPLAGDTWRFSFVVDDRPIPPPVERPGATWRVVRPGYFETMRMRMRGRTFDARDRDNGLPVAIVNETLARRFWPGANPIGHHVRFGSDQTGPWLTIVGVVTNARQDEWTGPVPPEVYVPYAQHATEFGGTELTFVLRTAGDPEGIATAASQAIWSVDAGVPVAAVVTLDRVIADRLGRSKVVAALLGLFAIVALVLAALGIYSITAYVMSRRTREIGIRMALGARTRHVIRLGIAETVVPVMAGVLGGCAAALTSAQLIASLLYDVAPGDPITFAGASAILVTVAMMAGWLPARRASRIDPLLALREE
jgi:predicted permease